MNEPMKPKPVMPKLAPEAVKALNTSLNTLGVMAVQYLTAWRAAAPGILANVAKALPQARSR